MDMMQSLISFVSENIGFIIAVIIVLLGFNSSKKKKQKAAEAAQDEATEKPKKKGFREMLAEIEAELNEENREKEPHIPYKPQAEAETKDVRTKAKNRINETIREAMEQTAKQKDSPWNVPTVDEGYGSPSTEGATLRERMQKPNAAPEVPWAVPAETKGAYNTVQRAKESIAPSKADVAAARLSAAAAIADVVRTVPGGSEAIVKDDVTADEIGDALYASANWERAALVNGIIMAEVLGKPKALRR